MMAYWRTCEMSNQVCMRPCVYAFCGLELTRDTSQHVSVTYSILENVDGELKLIEKRHVVLHLLLQQPWQHTTTQ